MRLLLTLSFLSCIVLFSCQKEKSFSNNNGGSTAGGATGTKLVKMVFKAGADSSVFAYSYNSSGKLITITVTGKEGGSPLYNKKTFVRNSQGIIQKLVMEDADFIQAGIDSVVYKVRYDVSVSRYTGWTVSLDFGNGIQKDSIVYVYDGTGKIINEMGYGDGGTGTYQPSGKIEYTHSGNNIMTKKLYSYDQGVYSLDFTITDEFDTKTAPLILGIEGIISESNSIAPYYSSNNITKETVTYPNDPAEILTITYTYNSSNKPASAIYSIPGGQSNVAYYYQ